MFPNFQSSISFSLVCEWSLRESIWLASTFDIIAALWGTRLTEDSSKSDIKIKTTIRELIVYAVFLILLLISNLLLFFCYFFVNLINILDVSGSLPREHVRAVLGVVILSIRPSVRPSVCLSHACIVTKLNDALQIFLYHTKWQSLCYLIPRSVGRRRPLPSEICAQSDPPPFEKRRLRPISAHNVSTAGDSEKSSITTNIKSTTGFPTSHRWSAYVTPKCPKGWLKERYFCFWVSSAVNLVGRSVL